MAGFGFSITYALQTAAVILGELLASTQELEELVAAQVKVFATLKAAKAL